MTRFEVSGNGEINDSMRKSDDWLSSIDGVDEFLFLLWFYGIDVG